MCCLVTGGKGSSRYPISIGAEAASSLVVFCALMVAAVDAQKRKEATYGKVKGVVVTPLLREALQS